MSELRAALVENMKRLRSQKGYSQAKLAELSDVSTGHVAEVETGNRFPSPEILEKIAQVLGVKAVTMLMNPDELLEYQEFLKLKPVYSTIADKVVEEVRRYLREK